MGLRQMFKRLQLKCMSINNHFNRNYNSWHAFVIAHLDCYVIKGPSDCYIKRGGKPQKGVFLDFGTEIVAIFGTLIYF